MFHQDIIDYFETWSPRHLAYDWDNVGVQIGSLNDKTTGVLITLDVMEEVIDEAIEKSANLIIAHHPLLFKSVKSIETNTVMGSIIEKAIKHNITIYAAHTNFDITDQGMNDILAQALKLENLKGFVHVNQEQMYKFVVFTPKNAVTDIREAINRANAGKIGDYSHCTYAINGIGSFKPSDQAQPFIGQANKMSEVEEVRLETIVSREHLNTLIESVKQVHPYEEMAYDCYPLAQLGRQISIGKIGYLTEKTHFANVIAMVKEAFNLQGLRYVGSEDKMIKKVAILGGSGEKYIDQAIKVKADLYISGDFTFHPAQTAMQNNLALIDAGHYIEAIFKQPVHDYLLKKFPSLNATISTINTNPFKFKS